jgi:ATP-binding cassette, subfamily B, bacterial
MVSMETPAKRSVLPRLFLQAAPYWPHLVVLFLVNLLSTPLALLNPVPLKIIVDTAFGDEPMPAPIRMFLPGSLDFSFSQVLLVASGLIVLIALMANLQGMISWVLQAYVGEKLVLKFRTLLFNQIQRLSLAYHDRVGISDSLYRIQYDASAIRALMVSGFAPLITTVFTLVAMLFVMTLIQWRFTLIALLILPGLVYVTRSSSAQLKHQWTKVKQFESAAMSVIHETMSALRVVKAFVREEHEEKRFTGRSMEALRGQMRLAYIGGFFDLTVGLLIATGTALFLYVGARHVHAGEITLGELIVVMAYLAQMYGPMRTLSKQVTGLQSSLVSLERAYSVIDREQDVKDRPDALPVTHLPGGVIYDRVCFEYHPGEPVIRDLSFEILPGQRVGVMGSTGAGKTTLLNLLPRFYEPTSGRILVDGQDIRHYRLADYRNQFSIVLQEPVLFSTTIAENIAYGRPSASLEEIQQAAMEANAHQFISRLDEGYDTEVGERGMQLSGGERQRVSIARAFLKNAPILILDEPTSSVDIATEALIMEATDRLMEGRTTFLITHRLDTLAQCDVLLHLEQGRLVEIIHNDGADNIASKIHSVRSQVACT